MFRYHVLVICPQVIILSPISKLIYYIVMKDELLGKYTRKFGNLKNVKNRNNSVEITLSTLDNKF